MTAGHPDEIGKGGYGASCDDEEGHGSIFFGFKPDDLRRLDGQRDGGASTRPDLASPRVAARLWGP